MFFSNSKSILNISALTETKHTTQTAAHYCVTNSPGRGDELHPQAHAPLPAVGQLQHGAPRLHHAVLHQREHAHLVEVEDHLELHRADHLQSLQPAVDLAQRAVCVNYEIRDRRFIIF